MHPPKKSGPQVSPRAVKNFIFILSFSQSIICESLILFQCGHLRHFFLCQFEVPDIVVLDDVLLVGRSGR